MSRLPARLGTEYELLEKLGQGGMGEPDLPKPMKSRERIAMGIDAHEGEPQPALVLEDLADRCRKAGKVLKHPEWLVPQGPPAR